MIRSSSILPFFALLIFVAGSTSTYIPCEDCTDTANTEKLAAITLRIYTGQTIDEYTTVLIGDAVELISEIDSSKPTVLYISGWNENPDSISVQTVIAAYVTRQDHNILLVDYSGIAISEWEYAASSANGVGYTLAIALDEMVAQGLDSTTLHVIGHSLGGQVSGYIGRYANFELSRITALDPAGPSFSESDEHLCDTDATFVDVIHTDPGVFGIAYSAGTVDFWPNGDSGIQPGCESDYPALAYAASHFRSWAYYAESLLNEVAFLAVACDSYTSFQAGTCSSGETAYMGYATSTNAKGDYILQTNSESPYGKEEAGIAYE